MGYLIVFGGLAAVALYLWAWWYVGDTGGYGWRHTWFLWWVARIIAWGVTGIFILSILLWAGGALTELLNNVPYQGGSRP